VLLTKFEVSSLSNFDDMFDRMPKIVGSRELGHIHIQGKLDISSPSSLGDIDAAMVDVTLNDL